MKPHHEEPQPPLITTPAERWHCRMSETLPKDNFKGVRVATVKAELVWGVSESRKQRNDTTLTVITGDVHHTLTGPTAQRSIEEPAP